MTRLARLGTGLAAGRDGIPVEKMTAVTTAGTRAGQIQLACPLRVTEIIRPFNFVLDKEVRA